MRDAIRHAVGGTRHHVVGSTLQLVVWFDVEPVARRPFVARHSHRAVLVPGMKLAPLYLATAAIAACATSAPPEDDRPQTLELITQAILAPSCGTAECHSALKAQSNVVLDSVAGARATFDRRPELVLDCAHVTPSPQPDGCVEAPAQSYLVTVITTGTVMGNLMPLDQGMSRVDIELIGTWIQNGAAGYTVKDQP